MKQFDYIVVGGGLAGLYSALRLSHYGQVALVVKSTLQQSNSYYAQGGIAAVTEEADSPQAHYQDTIEAGRGLCLPSAVHILTEEAPKRIEELIALGMNFDLEDGHLALGLEGGHHHKRILHAGGDATGRLMTTFMIGQVCSSPNIHIFDSHTLVALIHSGEVCYGITAYDSTHHQVESFYASATILATGGASALYQLSTNPPATLGDGLAVALESGVRLMDLEFVQFHPTALYLPGQASFLISEAVRGEGAHLLNRSGERFMVGKHPLAELAPRDLVARSIFEQMQADQASYVTLSLEHLDAQHIEHRFPSITARCREHGLELTRSIPVAPAAHYTVGGIYTDLNGATSLERLYAVGEVASTGVMGANRLASNSLIECLVFGYRAVEHIVEQAGQRPMSSTEQADLVAPVSLGSREEEELWSRTYGEAIMSGLGLVLSRYVGIVRDRSSLQSAIRAIEELQARCEEAASQLLQAKLVYRRCALALCIAQAALSREESRGGHYRSDFPELAQRAYRTSIIKDTIEKELLR
ncbi:MAG: L-aspartate oxidase [Porphyromonadaceae bacterium]|nr:L-aspartate oxidase [Porphyromonadaceae bacterium]